MGKYFGTDGFRGRANEFPSAVHAFRVGRFLGRHFSKGKGAARILIGKDTRRSSYTLEYSLAAGAAASGAEVYLLHVTTTPSVSYLTRTEGFDCGVMISASHNPFYDNGIKLFDARGEKLSDALIRRIEEYLDGGTLPLATGEEIGRTVDFVSGRNRYLAYLLSLPRVSFRGMRVGLDCANGSAFMLAKSVFDALGAEVFPVGVSPNGRNINEGCGSTHPESIRRHVLEHGLDVGFAFDGDADRCIACDEKGRIVDGDGILYLSARRLRARGELDGGGVVATPMSNSGLERSLKAEGIETVYADVGDRFVYEKMLSGGYLLGGEASGHIIFRKYAATGDGILTALFVMESILEGGPLSLLVEGYRPLPQELAGVRVSDPASALKAEEVEEAKREAQALIKEGRVVLRASGTEPVVRILLEGEDTAALRRARELLESALQRAGEAL